MYRDFADGAFPENCVLVTRSLAIRLFIMRFFYLTIEDFERMLSPEICTLVIMELVGDKNELRTPLEPQSRLYVTSTQ